MDSENKPTAGSPQAASSESAAIPEVTRDAQITTEFYRVRNRIYMSLLVFVVIAGLPVVSVPVLRHRLSGRVGTLREAMAGGSIKPVVVQVGENKEPFPSEYEKKSAPPNYPKLPAYFAAVQGLSSPAVGSGSTPGSTASPIVSATPLRKTRSIRIPKTDMDSEVQSPPTTNAQEQAPAAEQQGAATDAQPKYQQGQMEKEAYDFLLKSNATLSGMVLGSNPKLHFKSWDALKRDEEAYWVRLVFVSVPDNTNVEYIWQVKLLAKQITPLSYNARALATP